jgi:sphingomyelin phosphodiesterase
LDIQYAEGYSNICDDILCCHKENGVANNLSVAAGFFGDYKCDTPISLLDQTVRFIKKTYPDIKLMLVTGDMSAHNEWSKSIS